ncbi:hypothetical protein [Botryobacter ruber]|uniref:hypothetical protein n=1 Tax=Botryobacter ruber TaxID=2171629 RepID=UPI000E0A7BBB|nr:hypothetical protein [Botryobacter ruber]
MKKSTLNFWLLFLVSVILSAIAISFFAKALKLVLYVILVLALSPIVYILLKLIFPGRKKSDDDKLKKRY